MTHTQLLVRIGHEDAPDTALQVAVTLAQRLHADLDGVQIVPLPPAAFAVPEAMPLQMDTQHKQYAAAREREGWYHQQLQAAKLRGRWHAAQGDTANVLCHMAAAYDLLVLARTDEQRDAPLGYGSISHSVFDARCPVLILPQDMQAGCGGKRILVAWNGSRESTLALRGALPLMAAADDVCILDGSEPESAVDPLAPPTLDLESWLQRHAIEARIEPFHPNDAPGPAIEERAIAEHADLIVMGAWGRSRLSELILGGATRHLFAHSRHALLVAH
jgi:nucleotide-binding universal stress UspA family protein